MPSLPGLMLLLLALAGAHAPAAALEAEALIAYLDGLDSFAADFTQQRYDEDGELMETARGTCRIERPGRFRWAYREPYEQLIVSDGQVLWIYDPDLEQVTRSAAAGGERGSPAALLGRETDVAAHYVVTPLEDADGYAWFRLEPRANAGDFAAIELGFATGEVRAMRLSDNLGQLTTLAFTEVARNADIDDAEFAFVPPAGVDVVEGGAP